ncbi:hypothetical protein [Demetria terragena]|uniref:hypothetical protein n=1 Tax=Demetria terragena TaxID=63959 RepID=UPI00035D9BD8|nr:hypothetical protein [Demetria terragena]
MKRVLKFLGLSSESPEEGQMWHGVDQRSKTRIIGIALAFATIAYAIAYLTLRGIDGFPVFSPLLVALFTLVITTSILKGRHLEGRQNNVSDH